MERELWSEASDLERILALRSLPGFSSLEPSDLSGLASRMRDVRLGVGEHLVRRGELPRHVGFLVHGAAVIRRKAVELADFDDFSVLGALAAMSGQAPDYDVVVTRDSLALLADVDDMWMVFEDHFVLLDGALRGLAQAALDLRHGLGAHGRYGFPDVPVPPPAASRARLDLVERMARLRDALPFAGTRLEALGDLARDVEEVSIPSGHSLFRAGDPSGDFYAVVAGSVSATGPEGGAMRFVPGDVVGSIETFAALPRWFDATAEDGFVALRVERDALFDVLEDHFNLARALLGAFAHLVDQLLLSGAPRSSIAPGVR